MLYKISGKPDQPEPENTHTPAAVNKAQDLQYLELSHLCSRWYDYAEQAHIANNLGQHQKSIQLFERCVDISLTLINADKRVTTGAISLYYTSSHNLAACYNQIYKAKQGETLLHKVHEFLIYACKNTHYPRELRLDALASLDKSLFSLSAQLAYMGKTAGIQALIHETESIAEHCMIELESQT